MKLTFGRTGFSFFSVFVLLVLHAAAKPFNACWRSDSKKANKTKLSAKQLMTDFGFASSTLTGLTEFLYQNYVNLEKERRKNTFHQENNTCTE